MASGAEVQYELAGVDRFRFRSFEGDQTGLVFDTLSGDTHLLNLLGFELGLLLQEGPGTKSQLMAAFDNPDTPQTGAELSAGDEFSRALDEQLSRLKLLGLIRAKAV